MNKQRDNYTFLTQAPVHRVIRTMAVPTIISMLVTSLYNMADTFFVSKINTQCTAAVGIVFAVMSVIQAVGFFFGHGSGNYMSRHLGAKDYKSAQTMSVTGFCYSFGMGLLIAIVGHFFLSDLAIALGSTPTILPYSKRYLGILLLATPFMTTALTMNNQMRFQGNAAYAMVGILIGAVLNVVLDPLFIFAFDMGIDGAAWATVMSQTCSFFILLYMTRKNGGIRINLHHFSPRLSLVKEIIFGGTPSLSRQGLAALSTTALNLAAGAYGDAAIAGMSIVTRYCFFMFAIIIGLGQGFQPLCGFCYGAKLYKRVKEGYLYCIKIGTIFLAVCALLSFCFAEEIVALFRNDQAVIAVGTVTLRWQLVTFILLPTIGLTNMLMQTIRKPIQANIVAAARSGLYFIPLVLILPHFIGLLGVEICQAISDVCSFCTCVPIAYWAFKEMKRLEKENIGKCL